MPKSANTGFSLQTHQRRQLLWPLVLIPSFYAMFIPPWMTCILLFNAYLLHRLEFRARSRFGKWIILLAVFCGAGAVFLWFKGFGGRDAGIGLLLLMGALKAWEIKRAQDVLLIVLVFFFLTAGLFLYSQHVFLAAAALLCVWHISLAWFYLDAPHPLDAIMRPRALIASMLALALPGTLMLFLLFPRLQQSLWQAPADAGLARTGISDQLFPGSVARLNESEEIAFRVRFHDPTPAKHRMYWRALVFSGTDGQRWYMRSQPRLYDTSRVRQQAAMVRYTVILEPHGKRWLFSLDAPLELPLIGGLYEDFHFQAHDPVLQRLRYDATSVTDFQLPDRGERWRDALLLPPNRNPRTLELAARVRKQSADNEAYIANLLTYFRSQGFRYSLRPPALGADPVDDFLFDTQIGFCEHYATALAYLLRAGGIPARVVSGYQGGEYNPAGGYYIVRQKDAHAWVEVFMQNRWRRIDPTAEVAPLRLSGGMDEMLKEDGVSAHGFWHALWLRLDHADTLFQSGFNAFDAERQQQMAQHLGWRALPPALWLASVLWLPLLIIGIRSMLYYRARRRIACDAQRLLVQLCRVLRVPLSEKAGWETASAHRHRLLARHPDCGEHIQTFFQSYHRYRFSRGKNTMEIARMRRVLWWFYKKRARDFVHALRKSLAVSRRR